MASHGVPAAGDGGDRRRGVEEELIWRFVSREGKKKTTGQDQDLDLGS